MCELLVRAKGHWLDDKTQAEVDAMDETQKEHYYARSQKGDIIVIAPDGHPWGKGERLPDFVVIKIPGVKVKKFKHLTSKHSEVKDKAKMMWFDDDAFDAQKKIKAEHKGKTKLKTDPTIIKEENGQKLVTAKVEVRELKHIRKYKFSETVVNTMISNTQNAEVYTETSFNNLLTDKSK